MGLQQHCVAMLGWVEGGVDERGRSAVEVFDFAVQADVVQIECEVLEKVVA